MSNNKTNNNNLIKAIQSFLIGNSKYIIIIISIVLILFILFQIYDYFSTKKLKNDSIIFFNSLEQNENILENYEQLSGNDNFYSILSILKIIKKNNENKNFEKSNELYKKILAEKKINDLYKSSIASQASYNLINATYIENSDIYFNDILFYIDNINEELSSYYSIKKELEYLYLVATIDYNNSSYVKNSKVFDKFNEIFNSDNISSSVKERVKKIHDFQLYK